MNNDTTKREAELQEIEYLISDIFHNMSLPSTQSWNLGKWRDYATELLMPKIRASLAAPAVPDEKVIVPHDLLQSMSAQIQVLMNIITNPSGGNEMAKKIILLTASSMVEEANALHRSPKTR